MRLFFYFQVNYLGESRVFTPEQVVAALLVKLKQITENNLREVSKVTDCVVSVSFFGTLSLNKSMIENKCIYGQKNALSYFKFCRRSCNIFR